MTDMAGRARKILDDVVARWEQDPHRAAKMTWVGYDNTESDDDGDFDLSEEGDNEIILDSEDDNEHECQHYQGNLEGFVVNDTDPIETFIPEPQPPVLSNPLRDAFMSAIGGEEVYREMSLEEFNSAPPSPVAPAPPLAPQTIANVIVPALQANDETKDEENQCCLCAERISNAALIPCGHATFCMICIHNYLNQKLIDKQEPVCPTCNTKFQQVLRIYQ